MSIVNQLSQSFATITYLDQNRAPYTPSAVAFRIWDATNNVLVQDWTTITGPFTGSNTVTIDGSKNNLSAGNPNEARVVVFRITIGSTVARYDAQAYTVVAVPSGIP